MKRYKIIVLRGSVLIILWMNMLGVTALADLNKTVYLTFDDGPNTNITPQILEVLNNNNITATFFVVGNNIEENIEVIGKVSESNMSIMPHSYLHKYDVIYNSKKSFFEDFYRCKLKIQEIINKKNFNFLRIPGGINNEYCEESILKEIKEELKNQKINLIDWSVDIGDTKRATVDKDELKENINMYAGIYDVEVVLMHDISGKDTTVEVLQWVIDFYEEKGYTFKNLDNITLEEIEYLEEINVIK